MDKLKWKRNRVLSRYFQSVGKQMCRYTDDTKRLWKTTECCERARECIKVSLMTYPDS